MVLDEVFWYVLSVNMFKKRSFGKIFSGALANMRIPHLVVAQWLGMWATEQKVVCSYTTTAKMLPLGP